MGVFVRVYVCVCVCVRERERERERERDPYFTTITQVYEWTMRAKLTLRYRNPKLIFSMDPYIISSWDVFRDILERCPFTTTIECFYN